MSITTTELYFEVDEDDEEYKKINSEVSGFIFFFFHAGLRSYLREFFTWFLTWRLRDRKSKYWVAPLTSQRVGVEEIKRFV